VFNHKSRLRGVSMKSHHIQAFLAALVLLSGLCSSLAFAQQGTAALNGQVTDATGSAMAGAKVQALNVSTNITYSAETNESGLYNFPTLSAGTYQVTVSKEGFQQLVRPGVELHVSDVIGLNFPLKVGSVTQTVTVEGGAPLVETTSSELGGLVNDRNIANLPLNGRNYIDLSLLQAGVTQNTNMGTTGFGSLTGTTYSSNGAPMISNNFLLDGTQIGNQSGWGTASFGGTTLGVDGIKEYKVLTSAFDASYGMNMGSQMVMISKGGTNQFHGDIFEYLRNSALNARNFFDGPKPPQLEKNNFGGSFGGPIKKDKTFFYAVYEGLRENLGFTAVDQVPSAGCHIGTGPGGQAQAGDKITGGIGPTLCAQIPAGTSATIANSQIAAMLSLYPNPNNVNTATGLYQYRYGPTTSVGVNYGQIRVDQNFSTSDILVGRYTSDASNTNAAFNAGEPLTSGTAFPQFRGGGTTRDSFLTLSETHIFSPTVSNTARLSFSRTNFSAFRVPGDPLPAGIPSLIAGLPFGSFSISGLTGVGFGGLSGPPPNLHLQNIYSFADDVYWQRGKHQLRFGTLINRFNQALTVPVSSEGSASYSSLANFLQATLLRFSAVLPGSNINRDFIYNSFGFYAQDDWHTTSRLTLNLGLRYEFVTTPRELNGNEYAIRNISMDAAETPGPVMLDRTYLNVSPRFGFAWDVFGNGKTAVRGGGGIYYDVGNYGGPFIANTWGTLPAVEFVLNNPGALTFPVNLPSVATVVASGIGVSTVQAINYHAYQPHVVQYNLTVQRELPRNMAVSVAYVGSRAAHLWEEVEGNPTNPTAVVNGVPYWVNGTQTCANPLNAAGLPACRTNPHFGSIALDSTVGQSYYDSLQVVVRKRLSRGLESQAAYTYAHALDTAVGNLAGSNCGGASGMDSGEDANTRQFDYGPACFDARHNLRLSLTYHFPNLKSGGVLGKLANGWWMGNIVAVQSGLPFTPILALNRSNSANRGLGADRVDLGTATIAPGQDGNPANSGLTYIPYVASKVITGNPNQWFNPLMFQMPPLLPCPNNAALTCGVMGNVQRGLLRGPGLGNWDFSLVKDTAFPILGEQGSVQFRAEFFNVLNHTNFGMPAGTLFTGSGATPYSSTSLTSGVGQITQTIGTSRQIQFALKVIF